MMLRPTFRSSARKQRRNLLAAEAHKEPHETEPHDRSAPESDLDRFGDADRALATADGATGVAFVGSSTGLRRGSLVHEVLYRCALGDSADVAAWAHRLAAEQGSPELADEVGRFAATIIHSATMERVRAARRVWRELPLAWYDAGQNRYVEGFVDLAFEEADGWVLADYRPTRYRPRRKAASACCWNATGPRWTNIAMPRPPPVCRCRLRPLAGRRRHPPPVVSVTQRAARASGRFQTQPLRINTICPGS